MAKKNGRISLAVVTPIALNGYIVAKNIMDGDVNGAIANVTGYNREAGAFQLSRFIKFYAPIAGGVLVHKFLGPYVNRYIPKALKVGL